MNDVQWIESVDPEMMLAQCTARYSERRFRLLVVALARSQWQLIPEGEMRNAVDVAERHADGTVLEDEWVQYQGRFYNYFRSDSSREQSAFLHHNSKRRVFNLVFCATYSSQLMSNLPRAGVWQQVIQDYRSQAVPAIRDIFGNPFCPIELDSRWRTSDVVGLARAIYDDRAFERMPILADALMDAGCENEEIIGHCRGDGPHVRGCWVVDLILGKE